jgi:hypothetical protein
LSDDKTVPFTKPRPEQLTLEQVKALRKAGREDEIERARQGGHLEDVMKGKKPEPPAPPRSS